MHTFRCYKKNFHFLQFNKRVAKFGNCSLQGQVPLRNLKAVYYPSQRLADLNNEVRTTRFEPSIKHLSLGNIPNYNAVKHRL